MAGIYSAEHFHQSGLASRLAFGEALATLGKGFEDFSSILDFGAGCARILRWMGDVAGGGTVHGTDIDRRAITWSQRHIPFAQLAVNDPLPPLRYPDGSFDLVYSHSVFTHLDENYQDSWLGELRRITRPGATLLLTVNGRHSWQGFYDSAPDHPAMAEHARQFEGKGFHFVTHDIWDGIFPDFYHSMFHQKEYILQHWSQWFSVLGYLDRGMLDYQDIVVLRRE